MPDPDTRRAQLSDLLDAFEDEPIEPTDPRYFKFHKAAGEPRGEDSVRRLRTGIVAARKRATCQLFSGFRGSGKSTELRRLSKDLDGQGYRVVLVEGERYINGNQPLEPTDLLVSVAAAVAQAVEDGSAPNPARESLLTRISGFFSNTNVNLAQVGAGATLDAGGAKLDLAKLTFNLRTNPSFKAQVQDALRGRVDVFVEQFHDFMRQAKRAFGQDEADRPVLIVDDLEKVRGSGPDQDLIQQSVEHVFWRFHWALRIDG
jgi:AAA ATPase domain